MVAFKSYLMHDPPNSQLFLANLELAPFLTILTARRASRLRHHLITYYEL